MSVTDNVHRRTGLTASCDRFKSAREQGDWLVQQAMAWRTRRNWVWVDILQHTNHTTTSCTSIMLWPHCHVVHYLFHSWTGWSSIPPLPSLLSFSSQRRWLWRLPSKNACVFYWFRSLQVCFLSVHLFLRFWLFSVAFSKYLSLKKRKISPPPPIFVIFYFLSPT